MKLAKRLLDMYYEFEQHHGKFPAQYLMGRDALVDLQTELWAVPLDNQFNGLPINVTGEGRSVSIA